jgi:tetratricopeptide (TPR) repeat protein
MKTAVRKAVILSILVLNLNLLFSQTLSQKGFIKAIQAADAFYYYDEDFEKAAGLYEPLLKSYPENSNLCAKLGICYLNLDGKKGEALKLLKKASGNIVRSDKEYIEYGDQAPLDTYMYLAIAFHQNDSLTQAIKYYNNARKRLGSTQIFRNDYIDKQIKDCRYAMEVEKNPVSISENLFIPWLNEYSGAYNPVISANDSVFVFTVKKSGKTRILCSFKAGSWKKPVDITRQLGSDDGFYSNSITGDGKILIIYVDDGGDGNLYYSTRKDSTWTRIKSLGKNINTIYWESHGSVTPDGKTIYFSSNRPGGVGELDIWVSEKDNDGSWKRAVNCGRVINTPYNETTPFFDTSSQSLVFSSEGHSGMGGYDVFRSFRKNGVWTEPTGLPFALNNTRQNSFFVPYHDGNGFITSLYNEISGTRNIYSLVSGDNTVKTIKAEGTVTLQDGMPVDPKQTHIQLYDQKTGSLLKKIELADTGSFKYLMKPGQFKVLISRIGDKTDTINLNVKKEIRPGYKTLTDTASFKTR